MAARGLNGRDKFVPQAPFRSTVASSSAIPTHGVSSPALPQIARVGRRPGTEFLVGSAATPPHDLDTVQPSGKSRMGDVHDRHPVPGFAEGSPEWLASHISGAEVTAPVRAHYQLFVTIATMSGR